MAINRRQLALSTLGFSAPFFTACHWLSGGGESTILSAANNAKGEHFLVAMNTQGQQIFAVPVPQRAHQALAIANSEFVLFFGRRPSNVLFCVDKQQGQLRQTLLAPKGRHFYGHGVLDAQKKHLFVSENDYHNNRGVIGVYELSPLLKRIGEFDSGGLGPHQLARLHDSNTLVVANGGTQTHPNSGRKILNLDTMIPNLSYINLDTGTLIETAEPPHHRMSVRHLAVTQSNRVIVGIQDHREFSEINEVNPLVLSHTVSGAFTPLLTETQNWLRMNQYIASVAVSADGQWALTTTPRGHLASIWNLTSHELVHQYPIKDVAGAVWLEQPKRFMVSNGLGQWFSIAPHRHPSAERMISSSTWRWDNHCSLA